MRSAVDNQIERIVGVIQRRDAALRKVASNIAPASTAFGAECPVSSPGKPASDEALAVLEHRHGPLPPNYRAFLALHDGWNGFPDYRSRTRLFACADFDGEEAARFTAAFRAWRGNKTNPMAQNCLVIGAGPGVAYALPVPPRRKPAQRSNRVPSDDWWAERSGRIWSFTEKTRAFGDAVDFVAFLELRAHFLRVWREEALESRPIDSEKAAWAAVDDAIANFNYPEEQGEYIHESAQEIATLLERVSAKKFEVQHGMIRRLSSEIGDTRPFTLARRDERGLELFEHASERWLRK